MHVSIKIIAFLQIWCILYEMSPLGSPPNAPDKRPATPTSPKTCGSQMTFNAITTLRREVIFLKGR